MLESRSHKQVWSLGGVVSLSLLAAGTMLANNTETTVLDAPGQIHALPLSGDALSLLPSPQAELAEEVNEVIGAPAQLAEAVTEGSAFEVALEQEDAAEEYEWIAIEGLDFTDWEVEAMHDPYVLERVTQELAGRFDLEVEFADCTKMPCILGGVVQHESFTQVADAEAQLEAFRSEVAASMGTDAKPLVANIMLSDASNTQAFIVSALPETLDADEFEVLQERFAKRAHSLLREVDESTTAAAPIVLGDSLAGL